MVGNGGGRPPKGVFAGRRNNGDAGGRTVAARPVLTVCAGCVGVMCGVSQAALVAVALVVQ